MKDFSDKLDDLLGRKSREDYNKGFETTKANTEFMDWWRLLNEEMGKLHRNQQILFADAKGAYEDGDNPEQAARKLFKQWSH